MHEAPEPLQAGIAQPPWRLPNPATDKVERGPNAHKNWGAESVPEPLHPELLLGRAKRDEQNVRPEISHAPHRLLVSRRIGGP